ncbi:MAG: RNA polymerase factor sigma-54 [Acidobacteria bacterium]|nr:RNA polymerase factor sigma-54 [Acidobacteriota bacterium]MYJ03763.1 RNA polymerase factor sigma-54 [Acidobacteriota bacterium]
MAIQQRLQTQLSQKLVLTPSLQQAIKLLPMSTLELADLLNQEVVENPLLEEVPEEETASSETADTPAAPETDDAAYPEAAESPALDAAPDGTDAGAPEPAEAPATPDNSAEAPEGTTQQEESTWDDADYEYFFGDYLDDGYRPRNATETPELPPIENTLATAGSLSDHLRWQLLMQTDDDQLREIGLAIIGNLNEDGYLVASIEELAAMGNWSHDDVEAALALVQTLDPAGVAARDLQECLLLQIDRLDLTGTPSETIVREHLGLLQNHQLPDLARRLGLTLAGLREHVEVLQRLDPKPGASLNPVRSQYVIPDVSVVKVDDEFVAMLNEDGMPQLRISPVYRRMMNKKSENSEETRAYVREKFRSAIWLIRSIDQRQKTIQRVATSIIRFQRSFFEHGVECLRPMVLRDVADDIGMHESTVSRVVTNKYMHTPQGVFEMKYFFSSGVHTVFGENVSSVAIKRRIRKMIQEEDPRKPLSDSRIVQRLEENEGLKLARRTIAKYREEMKIPTSSRRRTHY